MSEKIHLGIPEESRNQVVKGLSHVLADTYTLLVKTHKYHWNVTGPLFPILHATFEAQYVELQEAVDMLAERIRSLGEFAPASFSEFEKLASIKENSGVPNAMAMVRQLLQDHETVARVVRSVIPYADAGEDDATTDLLTNRLRIHEKTAWMLRSMLES
jgi:starvation-inducible DNA-binding protein